MAVLTTPDCPASRNCEADRSMGSAFRMSYSTPLPEPSTETVQEAGTAWVLGWLAHYPFVSVKTPTTIQVGRL